MNTLTKKIKDAAYIEGDFTLRSGKKSTYYLDKYLFETRWDILDEISEAFTEIINERYADADILAAPELGAVAIVAAIAPKVKKNFVLIRKSSKAYGTSKRIEGQLKNASKILLIEDILTTGGAALEAAELLREEGHTVMAIMGTIDRLQGAQQNIEDAGFVYDSLFTINDLDIR